MGSNDAGIEILNLRSMGRIPREDREEYVYIGRPSKWSNPYHVEFRNMESRLEAIEKYRKLLWERIKKGEVTKEELLYLKGKKLVCWCVPLPCHGEVIRDAVSWVLKEMGE